MGGGGWGQCGLAETLVPGAGIHIYKHAFLFPFIKFYFVQLGENTRTTHQRGTRWFQEEEEDLVHRRARYPITEGDHRQREGPGGDRRHTHVTHPRSSKCKSEKETEI